MKHFLKFAIIFFCAIMVLACSQKEPPGKAILSGKLSVPYPTPVYVSVPNFISEDGLPFDEYEIQFEPDGSFSLSVPLVTPVYANLLVNKEKSPVGMVLLSPDEETKIEFLSDAMDKIQIKINEGKELTQEEFRKIGEPTGKFFYKVLNLEMLNGLQIDMSPEECRDYILNWTQEQIASIVDETNDLSNDQRQLVTNMMRWYTNIDYLFNYKNLINDVRKNRQQPETELNDEMIPPAILDKSYYSFLRFFDLNNPPIGNPVKYLEMYQYVLSDSVLNIPSIDSQPLADWMKGVKDILSDLTGIDSGLFYDLLATKAYLRQFDESKPLSGQQKKEIKAYFENPTFSGFLLTKNEEIAK